MLKLSDFISEKNITVLHSEDSRSIIEELIEKTVSKYNLPELAKQKHKLLKEKSISKGIEIAENILLSHTRNDSIDDIVFNIGFCNNIVIFSRKVRARVIFFILIPQSKSKIYLSLIAKLTRFLSSEKIQHLFLSMDKEAILERVAAFDS